MRTNQTRGWTVTMAGLGINLCLGVLYSWSVIKNALTAQLGWTNTAASIPYTVAILVFAFVMVPAGRLTDKWGPRIVATLGGVFVGGGMILASLKTDLTVLIFTFGILVGTGIGLGYAAPTPSAVKWFSPNRRGFIAGLVVAGFGLASVYIAPLTNYLLNFGIPRTFMIEGIIFAVAIILFAQFLSFPPKDYKPSIPAPTEKKEVTPVTIKYEYGWKEMLATPSFYIMWITFALGAGTGLMLIGHLASIAQLQANVSYGFILVALLAIANAGGRIVSGWLNDTLGSVNTLLLVFLIQAVNMFLFSRFTSSATIILGALVAGYCYGALLSLYPSLTYNYYGTKHAGINYGLVFTAWGIGGFIGPLVAGKIADLTGVYHNAFLITGIACIISAILIKKMTAPKDPIPIASPQKLQEGL